MLHCELLINGVFIGGVCDQGIGKQVCRSPFTNDVIGTAAEAGWAECDAALDSAVSAFESWRFTELKDRQNLLNRIANLIEQHTDELAHLMALEIGKPLKLAEGELRRSAITFHLASRYLESLSPEKLDLSFDPRGSDYECSVSRFPLGTIFCIAPYNWPFNLAAHKIAPALAAGNTVVLKGSELASLCTLRLAHLIHEAGCPEGVVNAINCTPQLSERMATDERTKMVSFTGSPGVGWHLKRLCSDKKVSLELGSDSSVIVTASADLEEAAIKTAASAFGYAGQVCISAQHVLAHRSIIEKFEAHLIQAAQQTKTGDPLDPDVSCGPLISPHATNRVQEWVSEAIHDGATVLTGANRDENVYHPTVIKFDSLPTRKSLKITSEEIFGPVVTLMPFDHIDEALAWINGSQYGIHASLFSNDANEVSQAYSDLEVGGLIVNDSPSVRFDNMPYGGVKRSGYGREGVKQTFEEMTEQKVLVLRKQYS